MYFLSAASSLFMAATVLLGSQLPLVSPTQTDTLNPLNWSNQPYLTLVKWRPEEWGMRTAVVDYKGHNGILKCTGDQKRHETELEVLRADNGDHCLVMELNKGHSLQEYIALANKKERDIIAANFIATALGAIVHLHKLEVVHGNLNPESKQSPRRFASLPLGMELDGFNVVLAGFEGAQIVTMPQQHSILGTRGYTPPEDFDNEPVDQYKRDSWMLGATLYAALAGVPPYGFAKSKKSGIYLPVPTKDLQHTMTQVMKTGKNTFPPVKTKNRGVKTLMKRLLVCNVKDRLEIDALTGIDLWLLEREAQRIKQSSTLERLWGVLKSKISDISTPKWQKPPPLSHGQ
ncbi:kinase-like domain-containing protein [Thamnocephalis sphaerospora]|uniref:Kinase-like domain-containing protein n=1 Tax=Thamnocephalis sphaerospora TaxID=78915 RepID=A0A4P9XWC1_9FUNG|nr:kinase-like domain-containing protein [Thamnocephalis sphaerospora]|eukprot:RKP09720.1 kinase-like domain-containing protein [Thamnocephalis sphaerospora]